MTPTGAAAAASVADPIELARLVARAADDKKADEVVVLEMTDLLEVTDYFVICSASNRILMDTIVDEAEKRAKDAGARPIGREGRANGGWLLIDFGAVVLHVFSTEAREFYRLDKLWASAPAMEWRNAGADVADVADQGA